MGNLYFGDNLFVLRDEIKSESVDLVYLGCRHNRWLVTETRLERRVFVWMRADSCNLGRVYAGLQ